MHIENDRTTTAPTIFKTRSLVADTSLVVLARAPAAPARARTSLQKTHLFLSFPYDCPEPVSVKWSFLHLKWRFSKKKGVFAHHRGSANSYHIRLPTTPAGKKRHNETTPLGKIAESQEEGKQAGSVTKRGCFGVLLQTTTGICPAIRGTTPYSPCVECPRLA